MAIVLTGLSVWLAFVAVILRWNHVLHITAKRGDGPRSSVRLSGGAGANDLNTHRHGDIA